MVFEVTTRVDPATCVSSDKDEEAVGVIKESEKDEREGVTTTRGNAFGGPAT